MEVGISHVQYEWINHCAMGAGIKPPRPYCQKEQITQNLMEIAALVFKSQNPWFDSQTQMVR